MTLIENILLEIGFAGSVSVSDITNAVTNMLSAKIVYDDGKPGGGKSSRIIAPVAYGLSTAGNPVLRAFQYSGSSKSSVPHWKLFNVTKISSWDTLENGKYDADNLVGFNKDGDKQMEIIYSIAPIGNAKSVEVAKNQNLSTGISSTPIKKSDVMKKIESDEEEEPVDNSNYTANNAINDVLRSANLSNITQKVDNSVSSNYLSNDNEVAPVTMSDIPGGDADVAETSDDVPVSTDKMAVTDNPIKKSDLDADGEKIKASFKDMMNRMDNLNKDDEEIEDEYGN